MSPRSSANPVYRCHNTAAHTRARTHPPPHTSRTPQDLRAPPPPTLTKTNMKVEIQARGQREHYKDCHCGIIHKAPELGERQRESSPGLCEEPRV